MNKKRYLSLIVSIVFLCYTVAGKDQALQKQQGKDGKGWKGVAAVVSTIGAVTLAAIAVGTPSGFKRCLDSCWYSCWRTGSLFYRR